MKLLRLEALKIIAYNDLIKLDEQKREEILIDLYSEDDAYETITDFTLPGYNNEIIEYFINDYKGIKNEYLENFIKRLFEIDSLYIKGKPEDLYSCPCCKYRTLEELGQYFICKVCFWEDDGSNNIERYSNVNHQTLKEGKDNFEKFGASSRSSINSIRKDVKLMYHRSIL